MVVKVMTAFVNQDEDLMLPLNRYIEEGDGVEDLTGYQAQLLCSIKDGSVQPYFVKIEGLDADNLNASVKTYEQSKQTFFSAYEVK